ncbi:hypothetical protein KbCgl_22820 [Corynebacterium glutamicum]|nr:hypothetical protein KbCgl_22820 [Corynebacterium glutamicum]
MGSRPFAFDEEVEIIAGFDSEVDLLTLFDANISSVFRNDFTRISDVVAENVADKGDDQCGFGGFFSLDDGL